VNIATRVKNILLSPVKEWGVIDGEKATVKSLYINYAAILALIPAITQFLGDYLSFGIVMPGRVVLFYALSTATINYILLLAVLYGIALIVNALTPKFGGQPDLTQALKVSVYSITPIWAASLFTGVLMLGFVLLRANILGNWFLDRFDKALMLTMVLQSLAFGYSLALFWLGLSKLMKAPKEKGGSFFIIALACVIALFFVTRSISNTAIKPFFTAIMQ